MAPNSVIAVLLNIGHTASHRSSQHPHGYTHDWSAYVKGAEGIDIHYFVEKVVFTLHETFAQPVQVVTKPPYMIHESGYASFGLKLDIHFANKSCRNGENIIHYEYDLYLPGEGQPAVTSFRQERLLFKTLPPEFRARLLAGGAKETDPENLTGLSKEREKRPEVLAAHADSLTPLSGEQKADDGDRKEKKKKSKDKEKSRSKKSKSDRDSSTKHPDSLLFGMSPPIEDKQSKEKASRHPASSTSSTSTSSSSSSPVNSPVPTNLNKSKNESTVSSDSSSDTDDDRGGNTNNNSTAVKRPISSNHISSTGHKKSRTSEKPSKKEADGSADEIVKGANGVPIAVLVDLHDKIAQLNNPNLLQRCVDAIEETRQYELTDTTFDFDLCTLDAQVIHKLETLLK